MQGECATALTYIAALLFLKAVVSEIWFQHFEYNIVNRKHCVKYSEKRHSTGELRSDSCGCLFEKKREEIFARVATIERGMYSVHLTPGRSSEKESTSKNVDGEVAVYKNRRKESIPVKVFNYLKMQMQTEGIPKGDLEELGGVLGGSTAGALALGGRHKPEELATLAANTRFSRKEIQLIYRGFKQECPTGLVDEEAFKQIFSQFFPQGDASQYAHYVFNTMKRKPSGKISFEEFLTILSKVSRGSVEEKLQWVFGLYDLDGDGLISKEEMLDVVGSIYEMLGRYTQPQIVEPHVAAREHVDRIFHLMDSNKDGVVTIEELVQWCSKDEQLLRSLDTLDTVL